jgi:hypothetical protein
MFSSSIIYALPLNIIRTTISVRTRWPVKVTRVGEMRTAYKILVGKPEGKRSIGRPRRRWENNIEIKIVWESVDWIHLAQDKDR